MIRQIKSLYSKTLARIVPLAGVDGKQFDARTIVHRRVEVTVERESVLVVVPGQPQGSAGQTVAGPGDLEVQSPELPPWLDAAPKRLGATGGGKLREAKS